MASLIVGALSGLVTATLSTSIFFPSACLIALWNLSVKSSDTYSPAEVFSSDKSNNVFLTLRATAPFHIVRMSVAYSPPGLQCLLLGPGPMTGFNERSVSPMGKYPGEGKGTDSVRMQEEFGLRVSCDTL